MKIFKMFLIHITTFGLVYREQTGPGVQGMDWVWCTGNGPGLILHWKHREERPCFVWSRRAQKLCKNVSIRPLFGGVTQSSKRTTPKSSRSRGGGGHKQVSYFSTCYSTHPPFSGHTVQPDGRTVLWPPGKDGFKLIGAGHTLRSQVTVPLGP